MNNFINNHLLITFVCFNKVSVNALSIESKISQKISFKKVL